jgi:hypothetical protein
MKGFARAIEITAVDESQCLLADCSEFGPIITQSAKLHP